MQTYLKNISNTHNLILVHNTFSSREDIHWANEVHKKLFWCFCPNANLYIENRLPKIELFIDTDLVMVHKRLKIPDWISRILKEWKSDKSGLQSNCLLLNKNAVYRKWDKSHSVMVQLKRSLKISLRLGICSGHKLNEKYKSLPLIEAHLSYFT